MGYMKFPPLAIPTCQYYIGHVHRIMLVSVQLLETNAEVACVDVL